MSDLVEDREAVVEQLVEDVVEQVARALCRTAARAGLVVLAPMEEPGHRQQLDVGKRHEVVLADEDVELGRVQALDCLS